LSEVKAKIKQDKKIYTFINVHRTKYQKSLPSVHFHNPHTITGQEKVKSDNR